MSGYSRSMTSWDVRAQLQAWEGSLRNVGTFDGAFGLRKVRNFGAGARESMDERLEQEVTARRANRQSKPLNGVRSGRIQKGEPAAPKTGIHRLTGPGQSNIVHGRAYAAGHNKRSLHSKPTTRMLSKPTKGQIAQNLVRDSIKGRRTRAPPVAGYTRTPALKMSSTAVTKEPVGPGFVPHTFGTRKPKIRQAQVLVPIKRR